MISDNKADKLSCEWAPTASLLPNLLGRTNCLNEVASMLNACSLAVISSTLSVYHSTMAVSKALLSVASPFIYVGSLGYIEISGKYINFSQALGHKVQATAYVIAAAASLAGIIAPHFATWVHTEMDLGPQNPKLPLHAPNPTCIKSIPIDVHGDMWSCDWSPTASLLPRIVNRDSCANEIAGIVNALSLPIMSACCAIYHFGMAPTKLALRLLSPFVYCGTLGAYHLREKHITSYEVVGHSLKGCAYVAGALAACAALLFPQFTLSAHDTLGLIVPQVVPGKYVEQDEFFDEKIVRDLTSVGVEVESEGNQTGENFQKESVEEDLIIDQSIPTLEDIKSRTADADFDNLDGEGSKSSENSVNSFSSRSARMRNARSLRRRERNRFKKGNETIILSDQEQIVRLKGQLKKTRVAYKSYKIYVDSIILPTQSDLHQRNISLQNTEMHLRHGVSELSKQNSDLQAQLHEKERLIQLLTQKENAIRGDIENQTKLKTEIDSLRALEKTAQQKITNLSGELENLNAVSVEQELESGLTSKTDLEEFRLITTENLELSLQNVKLQEQMLELDIKFNLLKAEIETYQAEIKKIAPLEEQNKSRLSEVLDLGERVLDLEESEYQLQIDKSHFAFLNVQQQIKINGLLEQIQKLQAQLAHVKENNDNQAENESLKKEKELLISSIGELNSAFEAYREKTSEQSEFNSERIKKLTSDWRDAERIKFDLERRNKRLLQTQSELEDKVHSLEERSKKLQAQVDGNSPISQNKMRTLPQPVVTKAKATTAERKERKDQLSTRTTVAPNWNIKNPGEYREFYSTKLSSLQSLVNFDQDNWMQQLDTSNAAVKNNKAILSAQLENIEKRISEAKSLHDNMLDNHGKTPQMISNIRSNLESIEREFNKVNEVLNTKKKDLTTRLQGIVPEENKANKYSKLRVAIT